MKEEEQKDKSNSSFETFRALAQFSQIGITMAASVLFGVLLGKFLDGVLGTTPWLLLIFSLLGAGSAIKLVFNSAKKKK